MVDVEEHLLLALRQRRIGEHGVGDGARGLLVEDPGLHVQGLRGDPQTFGDLLEDFFGLDSGAQIGLEYRFGLLRGTQVGIHRTSDRTIEFFSAKLGR